MLRGTPIRTGGAKISKAQERRGHLSNRLNCRHLSHNECLMSLAEAGAAEVMWCFRSFAATTYRVINVLRLDR